MTATVHLSKLRGLAMLLIEEPMEWGKVIQLRHSGPFIASKNYKNVPGGTLTRHHTNKLVWHLLQCVAK